MKTLIIYYSYEGTTKSLVEAIQKNFTVEVEQIKVENEKQHKGLVKYIWGGGQVIQKKEPKISGLNHKIEEYDRIILGTPVWANSYAPAIRSFLKKVDLKNKEVGYFCTNMGGKGHTFEDFEASLSGSKIIGKLALSNVKNKKEESVKKILKWVEEL
jgi:flavodoxin